MLEKFGPTLQELKCQKESSTFLDSLNFSNDSDLADQIDQFLQPNLTLESEATRFQSCDSSSVVLPQIEPTLGFRSALLRNHFELSRSQASICFHNLMVVISADLSPDIHFVRRCWDSPSVLSAEKTFLWVDPQLFRLLLFERASNSSWGEEVEMRN
jgi:hypothetical protein